MKSAFITYIILSVFVLVFSVFGVGIKSFLGSVYLSSISPSVTMGQGLYNNIAEFIFAFERSGKLEQAQVEILNLSEKVKANEQLKQENKLLKQTLNIKEFSFEKSNLVLAKLVFIDKSNATAILSIPQQYKDKIQKGSAVIYSDTLVGVVNSVSGTRVLIDLVTNPNFVTEGIDINTGANGIVKGVKDQVVFSDVLNSQVLNLNDIVVTLQITGEFNNQYIIGKVKEVQSTEGEPFQTAIIDSFLDLKNITTVLIDIKQ